MTMTITMTMTTMSSTGAVEPTSKDRSCLQTHPNKPDSTFSRGVKGSFAAICNPLEHESTGRHNAKLSAVLLWKPFVEMVQGDASGCSRSLPRAKVSGLR